MKKFPLTVDDKSGTLAEKERELQLPEAAPGPS